MTGPLDFLTTLRFSDMELESSGGRDGFAAASVAACWARAWGVQALPVITAAAPITALRMMNVRRSMPEAIVGWMVSFSGGAPFLGEGDVFIFRFSWFFFILAFAWVPYSVGQGSAFQISRA